MQPFPKLTLVTGAAASGKSRWAEKLVQSASRDQVYIATAQAFDDEMRTKIAQHKKDRGPDWRTIEAPLDLSTALDGFWQKEIILIDCLTMWLSNNLLAENDIEALVEKLLARLGSMKVPVVLVTNEVGASIVPENPLARQFQREQGRLNQRMAERADLVLAVMAGLPLTLKGHLPQGIA